MLTRGPLIGRERELALLERMLESPGLLTLTGPGGCGKTRVALELAYRSNLASGGFDALIAELATAGTADEVVARLLGTLRVRERGGRSAEDVLLRELAYRQDLLVVLDNCEQVAGQLGALLVQLLAEAPTLRLLATSREPLHVAGERVLTLAPLGLPDADGGVGAVVRSDAGRFFVDRAAGSDPEFELTSATARAVIRICRQLDGLPLALELAAVRAGDVPPAAMAADLEGHDGESAAGAGSSLPQHRSLTASLDWSLRLLDREQRTLLLGVSVFAGGFTAAAAREVALPAETDERVRGLLAELEAKGLVISTASAGAERWTLLQTVAEHARRLLTRDDAALQGACDRHLAWFRRFAVAVDELLIAPSGSELVDAEAPNLRLALARALERDHRAALEMVAWLTRHWILAEHFEEARTSCQAVLAATGAEGDAGLRAVVHFGAGLVAAMAEDYAEAIGQIQAGLGLAGEIEDADTDAHFRRMSSMALILTGLDPRAGLGDARRAVEEARASGDVLGLAWGLVTVAFAEGLCDRFEQGLRAYEEFVAIPGVSDHVRLRTWGELAAAYSEVMIGSPERALAHAERAIELEGSWPSMTHFMAVSQRIHALARLGLSEDALTDAYAALARAQESGAVMAMPAIEMPLAVAELLAGDIDGARARATRAAELPQPHTAALMRETLGYAALAAGDEDEALAQAAALGQIAELTGSARQRAVAQLLEARARLASEPGQARELLQSALAAHAELGRERDAADVLDALAILDGRAGDTVRAARLAGAAAAARQRIGYVPLDGAPTERAALRALCTERDGERAWETAWREGTELELSEAIAYARRARGPRGRPRAGWASLTPAEREVAELVATGMSNPEIAAKLFMSRSTVKMHLSSVYDKLEIANRTELARALTLRTGT